MLLWVKKPDECHKERQQTPNPGVATVYTTNPGVALPTLSVDTLLTLAAPPPPDPPLLSIWQKLLMRERIDIET